MTAPNGLRAIPVDDRAWLTTALADALDGGAPVLPVPPEGLPAGEAERLQAEDLPDGTALVVRTSGSSGVPKAVALPAEALRASAAATHEAFGGPGQWLVALPTHLIAGVQMLLRSELAGLASVFAQHPFDPARFLESANGMDAERRYVSLVPVQFARLLDLAERDRAAADDLRRFDAVLVGGQAVPLDMRSRAHELGVALKRSYGMTETAGGCVYDGVEIGDTRVRIRGGEVQLAGSALALGYVGGPVLTSDRFIEEGGRRWYRTGDAGEMLGGMLTVTGRLDRVIVSGGVNVSLDEVERVVHELPGWQGAVAQGVPHPEWGERVALVVEGGLDLHHDDVRRVLRERLGAAAVPELVSEIGELPRLANGKPDMRAIANWARGLHANGLDEEENE